MNGWYLPRSARFGGVEYPINADFRDILEIIGYLEDRSLPEFIRWHIALVLFYQKPVPEEFAGQAMDFLAQFLCCGQRDDAPGPKLLDWNADANLIIADVNKVAGQEIRALKFVHWWTFLGWFHALGEGQLSTVVGIRSKLRRGKKLDGWEQEYLRHHRAQVVLKQPLTAREEAEKQRLNALLGK